MSHHAAQLIHLHKTEKLKRKRNFAWNFLCKLELADKSQDLSCNMETFPTSLPYHISSKGELEDHCVLFKEQGEVWDTVLIASKWSEVWLFQI